MNTNEGRGTAATAPTQYVLHAAIHFMKAEPPEAILKLLDNGAGLEAGDVKGIEAAITKLAEQYPDVVKIGGKRELTVDEIKKMTPEEAAGRMDEINAVMAKQAKAGKS